ncbi:MULTISPECIES: GlxA family transcriptional regulator [Roseobacteraceae]|jgi:transcriptional regulator GlxA family with amidase domain|uniref:HTH-type transcriptional regulator CdhR n=1 Tax=Pseudosulfitobacter pseudonitzschiae TaxID=1402135 RepID=A0A221K4E0_9RHOB|nr:MULTISPECIES: GlxA family transcriptional regulator [Roseobacteraceae]ASM73825.1 HTH-type transcriptional regulator CdhR [Pseudosulfitobacter pseudonitzschiae]
MTIVPRRYVFLLIPGYSQLGFACALEALSLANLHPSRRTYYTWTVLSENGAPVPAYNGITTAVDGPLTELRRDDTLVVCAGEKAGAGSTKPVLNWLRRETRRGIDFGALSSGAYTLALAGLLSGKRVVTHWQYRDALCELLPDVIIEKGLFAIDGRVFTTAGGAASMDMMLARIRDEYGQDLATWVADQMVYTHPRQKEHAQRMSAGGPAEARNPKLALALQAMANNLEDPLRPDEIADLVGLSTRQLERLFAKYLAVSPKRHYLSLRLEKARGLLRQTSMSVTDICVACGFQSLSHFSKCYRSNFGLSPGQEMRGTHLLWTS